MDKQNKVVIIGAGKVGQTLGYLLHRTASYKVSAISTRHKTTASKAAYFIGPDVLHFTNPAQAAARGKIVFITTPDNAIENTCLQIARAGACKSASLVIHCSGNFSSDILKSARSSGIKTASVHPLQTFATPKESIRHFPGTYCVYEGDSSGQKQIIHIIKAINGIPVKINKAVKPLYHAAGVIASNYLVTLIDTSVTFLKRAGFTKRQALQAIMPLVEGTLKNISQVGLPDALTGPIARGDHTTVREHLVKMKSDLPDYLPFYTILGNYTIKVAREKKTLSPKQAVRLRRLLNKL